MLLCEVFIFHINRNILRAHNRLPGVPLLSLSPQVGELEILVHDWAVNLFLLEQFSALGRVYPCVFPAMWDGLGLVVWCLVPF